jgi:hypothetical protein
VIDGPPTEALRLRSADVLRDGLLRLLVTGEEQWLKDWRDLLVAMAPYHDCAMRIGVDPGRFFDEVSREGPPTLAETVRTFGQRTDITPSAFGFTVTTLQEGPAYEWPDFDYEEVKELEAWLEEEDDDVDDDEIKQLEASLEEANEDERLASGHVAGVPLVGTTIGPRKSGRVDVPAPAPAQRYRPVSIRCAMKSSWSAPGVSSLPSSSTRNTRNPRPVP